MIETDVCIIGAGPGGVAAALKLSYSGIPCVLYDKAVFPRDKICGDAISGKVTTLLNRLDPQILSRFKGKALSRAVWGIRIVAPNKKVIDLPFKHNREMDKAEAPGCVSKRMDFDHFLIGEVKRRPDIRFFEGVDISRFERTDRGFLVADESGKHVCSTKLLIVANGAQSAFSRRYAGLPKEPEHIAAALRVYYKNVKGLDGADFIELHYIKSIVPGYFWIFPLPNGQANVGIGMRSDILRKKKINLRKTLEEIIGRHPDIRERFSDAEQIGSTRGYSLPLGSGARKISGDHFMLVGDAGHLVDPLTGEGIGNAFYSGFIAAEQALQCLEKNDFSAAMLKAYDARVARVLGAEMRLSYRVQKMLLYPWVVNALSGIITGNSKVMEVLSGMYVDFDLRQQLTRPVFWLKMWLKK